MNYFRVHIDKNGSQVLVYADDSLAEITHASASGWQPNYVVLSRDEAEKVASWLLDWLDKKPEDFSNK